jgi:hypothetical protein
VRALKNAENPRGAGHGGARPNSGRKSKAALMGLKALLDKCWTPEDRESCVRELAMKARGGDMEAVKLLFNYAFGKPREHRENSGELAVRVVYENRPIEREAEP